ncbi:DNA-directed RNA polymerase subunit alpha [Candidatus Uhrbacteria bacterium]|nr:DNA-directed RNA polymerase subunit alpha [Candidatus Uhrbacteria bacterium]
MSTLPLPTKLEFIQKDGSAFRGQVILEPCAGGYGTTVGNALRRVLLSSLPGAAITAVKIKGAQHEFSTIPNIKEDLVEILLNIKQIRLRSFAEGPVSLTLSVKGERAVTAGDIEKNSDVEVVSTHEHIATITDPNGSLEMEFTVERGRGYVPVESRDTHTKLPIGMIAVDAIYTPVVNVGYHVEHVRVGHMTNFDKLILDVETDGTIAVEEAVRQSARILIEHFSVVADGPKLPEAPAGSESIPAEATASTPAVETTPTPIDAPLATPADDASAPAGEGEVAQPKKRGRKKKAEEDAAKGSE